MFASNNQNLSHGQRIELLKGLSQLPSQWALTPVKGDKRPYRPNWQSENPLSPQEISADIKSGKAKGYGLRTGVISAGIVAIDADGSAAIAKLREILGDTPLPETVSFTSGREGRCQYLFQVPEEYWGDVSTKKIGTRVKGDDGKEQLLELRWDGCQSVLPPSVHPDTGRYRWVKSPQECVIAKCPTALIELMLNETPSTEQQPNLLLQVPGVQTTRIRYEDIQVPVPEAVPLEVCLSKDSRQLLKDGLSDGGRNDTGAKLARDLIGTTHYLQRINQRYEGDAWDFFNNWCISVGLDTDKPTKQPENIWKSAIKDNPTPSCTESGVNNCIKAWYWNKHIKPHQPSFERGLGGSGGSNNRRSGGGDGGDGDRPELSEIGLRQRVLEIVARKQSFSEQTEAFMLLASSTGRTVREIQLLADAIEKDSDAESEKADALSNLPKLLKNHCSELNPVDYLWGDSGKLGTAMNLTAAAMPTASSFIFTTLIATIASRIGTSSRIIIKPSGQYKQPCIFWTAIVSRSGTLKTPAQKVAIDPLVSLETQSNKDYKKAMEEYKEAKENYKEGDPNPKQTAPRKRYLTKDPTLESLERITSAGGERGILYYRDELAGMFKTRNAYRAGKGADMEAELDQWNGSAIIVDRKEREICIERSAISRTGAIQWDVLQEQAGDHNDSNGVLARWLFCGVKAPARYINFDDDIDTGISEMLLRLYQNLEKLPQQDYLIDKDAQQIFERWQHQLTDAETQEKHPGLRLVYPKIEAYTARLALWLHCVNAVLAGETPRATIPGNTMFKAVELASFFLGQAKLIYTINSPQSGLTGRLLKLYHFVEGKTQAVAPRMIKSNCRPYRTVPTTDICRDCDSLVSGGYFKAVDGGYVVSVDSVDALLSAVSAAETTENQLSQAFVDTVDAVDTFKNDPPLPDNPPPEQNDILENVNNVNKRAESPTESDIDTVDSDVLTADTSHQQVNTVQSEPDPITAPSVEPTHQQDVSPQRFKKGDKVTAVSQPQWGVGVIDRFEQYFDEYNVVFNERTAWLAESDLQPVQL